MPSPAFEALTQATAGATSGAFAAFALHPLELVKTRIQTGLAKPPISAAVAEIWKLEGLPALYRGVGVQCCEEAVENFVFFYLYDLCLKLAKLQWRMTAGLNLTVGYVAGVGTTTLVLPIEVLSTRLQLSHSGESLTQVLRRMVQGGGLGGLFKGYWLNLILCANPAIQNTFFDMIKKAILRRKPRGVAGQRPTALSPLESLALGALSKAVALAACYPLVRLKVSMQAGKQAAAADEGSSADGALARAPQPSLLLRLSQLYRGLGTALAKNVVSAALMYMLKDQIIGIVVRAFARLAAGGPGQRRSLQISRAGLA